MTTRVPGAGVFGRRRWLRGLVLAGGSAAALGLWAGPAVGQQPPAGAAAANPNPGEGGRRVVAFVYGNVPVTREELGEFLIARGGYDKLKLLVNKKVIEIEAARRGITVTPQEVEAGLNDDLGGIGMNKADFVKLVLPRYNKTLYEWTEDVIRPRLLLGKMFRDRVKVTEDEVRRAFETRYGERREAALIAWPANQELPAEVRQKVKDPIEFDRVAAAQPRKDLQVTGGRIKAVGRHLEGEDPNVLAALFALKPGEVSDWIKTVGGEMVAIKCLGVIPPDAKAVYEKLRPEVEKELLDRKLNAGVPDYFAELEKAAAPQFFAPPAAPHPNPQVLAVIYGNAGVTREDLGEFLIARGGYEKLELLVNRKIIDTEAARRGVTVTPQEIDAALIADLRGLGLGREGPGISPEDAARQMKEDFVKHVLPRYGKTLFEWTEDVIKPRLLLGKMCRDRVKVTDDDLKRAFENRYGEKRQPKLIIWQKDQFRVAQKQWDEARKGDAEFDRIARGQYEPNLASAAGLTSPVGRYTDAENTMVETVLFTLKEGEVSQLFETPAGIVCVKCVKVLPPDGSVKMEQVRPALEKEVFDRKLAKEIPAFFGLLREQANPNVLLKGPPTARENLEGVKNIVNQAGGPPPGSVPPGK